MEFKYPLNLKDNINTGIEYEIVIFMLLLDSENLEIFKNSIKERKDLEKILNLYEILKNKNLKKLLNLEDIKEIELTTQDDSVGPADIVINKNFGLSIKYNNQCNSNPSGKKFLNESQISFLKESYKDFLETYKKDMISQYGSFKNWFRKRKCKSLETLKFINSIKDLVIENWKQFTDSEKLEIFSNLYHFKSPIDYVIIQIKKNDIEVEYPQREFLIDKIQLKNDCDSQYLLIEYDNNIIGKMQVKFNNGVLERYKGIGKVDEIIDGVSVKYGNFITSWNYNICKNL